MDGTLTSPQPEPAQGPHLLAKIEDELVSRQARTLQVETKRQAAVAMLLHANGGRPELLFIERAAHPSDPWSGNLAFPGGRVDPGDSDNQATAERETREEVAFDPAGARLLGRLDDIGGAYLPVIISCFVYRLKQRPIFSPNEEVADLFWFPLDGLTDLRRHCRRTLFWHGQPRQISGIDLLGPQKPLLWGITYRLIMQLLTRVDALPQELAGIIDD